MSYPNGITSKLIHCCNIPPVMESDRAAIQLLVKVSTGIDLENLKIIRIPNSLFIENIMISEALLEEARANPDIEIVSEPFDFPFDEKGNLF